MVARADKKESEHEGKCFFVSICHGWKGGKGYEQKEGGKKVKKDFFRPGFLHVPFFAHSLEKFLAPAAGLMNTASKLPEKNRINYYFKFDPFSKNWYTMLNPKGIHVHRVFLPNNSSNPSLKMGGRNRASFLPFLSPPPRPHFPPDAYQHCCGSMKSKVGGGEEGERGGPRMALLRLCRSYCRINSNICHWNSFLAYIVY